MGNGHKLLVENLGVQYRVGESLVDAVEKVTFTVKESERLGLVGESGSGKSVIARAILNLIKPPGHIVNGTILLDGQNIFQMSAEELRRVRGKRIALIHQDSSTAMNPVFTVGEHLIENMTVNMGISAKVAQERAVDYLNKVGIASPESRLKAYPYELSGGMKQRVGIAMALVCEPELIIADSPTSAVDVTIQAQILRLFRSLTEETGTSVLFISHDLRVISQICHRVIVLYDGQIAEIDSIEQILSHPRHPYTKALLEVCPTVDRRVTPLPVIPGSMPNAFEKIGGCRFHPRCPRALPACSEEYPPLKENTVTQGCYACWNPQ